MLNGPKQSRGHQDHHGTEGQAAGPGQNHNLSRLRKLSRLFYYEFTMNIMIYLFII